VCGTEGLSVIVSVLKSMGVCDMDSLARLEGRDVFSWVDCEREEGVEGHRSLLVRILQSLIPLVCFFLLLYSFMRSSACTWSSDSQLLCTSA
jgi:hypothetical protein